MAIEKDITSPSTAVASYHRLANVQIVFPAKQCVAQILGYVDEAARHAGAAFLTDARIDLVGEKFPLPDDAQTQVENQLNLGIGHRVQAMRITFAGGRTHIAATVTAKTEDGDELAYDIGYNIAMLPFDLQTLLYGIAMADSAFADGVKV